MYSDRTGNGHSNGTVCAGRPLTGKTYRAHNPESRQCSEGPDVKSRHHHCTRGKRRYAKRIRCILLDRKKYKCKWQARKDSYGSKVSYSRSIRGSPSGLTHIRMIAISPSSVTANDPLLGHSSDFRTRRSLNTFMCVGETASASSSPGGLWAGGAWAGPRIVYPPNSV